MVKSFNVTYVPGGATQNTIRIAQVVNLTTIFVAVVAVSNTIACMLPSANGTLTQ